MPAVLSVSHNCYNPSSSALKLCYVSNMQIHMDLQVSFVFPNSTRTITGYLKPRQLMQQSPQFNNTKSICAAQWLLTSPMILITSDQCSTCQLRLSIEKVLKPAQNLVSTITQLHKFPYFSSIVGKHQSTVRKVACTCTAVWKISAKLIPCQ